MYRFENVKYAGQLLSEYCEVQDVRLPVLPSRTINTLNIPSRDGSIFNGKKYESYSIEIDVLIDCDTLSEAKEKLKGLKELFDVESPKPFSIDDDKFILAITDDAINKESVAWSSYELTIKLFCAEPYFYSYNVRIAQSDTNIIPIENDGNRPVLPIVNVGFSKDAHFALISLKETGQNFLVGNYPKPEKETVTKSTKVLDNDCNAVSGWTQSSASIDSDRTVGGTLTVKESGNGLTIGELPSSATTTWKGSAYRINLDKQVDEFKLTAYMCHNSIGENGNPEAVKYKTDTQTVVSGKVNYYYKVNCSSLNVRSGAGTKYKKIGSLKKGFTLKQSDVIKIVNGWVKFEYKKDVIGYACCKYFTQMTQETRVTTTTKNMVVVSNVALRSSASKSAKNQITIKKGECIRCITSKKYPSSGTDKEKFYKLDKKYKGYSGYVLISCLEEASDVVFEYPSDEDAIRADSKQGIIELYGFDVNGKKLFKCGMYDDSEWYEATYPMAQIGSRTVLQESSLTDLDPKTKTTSETSNDGATITVSNILSGRKGDWNEFYGKWIITKEKVSKNTYEWTVSVEKIKDGSTVKTKKKTGIRYSDLPKEKLSYVVVYLGTTGDLANSSAMSLNDVVVRELNPSETTNKNVTYFKEGDVLEIDCESHRCYLNEEPCDYLVDIGSRYFEVPIGESEMTIHSDDTDTMTTVIYREKYLGGD